MRTIVTVELLLLPGLGSQVQKASNKLCGTLDRFLTSTKASTAFGVEPIAIRLKEASAKDWFAVVARGEEKNRQCEQPIC